MIFFVIIAIITVLYTIISSIIKRSNGEKSITKQISVPVITYVSYGNIIYSIFLAGIVAYVLYDKTTKTIDIYSLILILLIIILGIFKLVTQYFFKPILSEEGILFYSGAFLTWDKITEIEAIANTKNDEPIVLVGGKSNFSTALREKIVIPKESKKKFEILINNKTKVK